MRFGIDISKFTTDELYGLQDEISKELRERSKGWEVTVDPVYTTEKSGRYYS
jgi:hypothetical protein